MITASGIVSTVTDDNILTTKAYTVYTGIVPGSATIFVLDESEGVGRLDLTLLEGVMIVVEVTDAGYKVCCLRDDDGMWVM